MQVFEATQVGHSTSAEVFGCGIHRVRKFVQSHCGRKPGAEAWLEGACTQKNVIVGVTVSKACVGVLWEGTWNQGLAGGGIYAEHRNRTHC